MLNIPRLPVAFFRTASGREPVREWLRTLDSGDRKRIGEEIKTVQFGWPIGMPLVRKMEADLWEVRVNLPDKIARVLFTLTDGVIVLLHGFIKKDQKTPKSELDVARRRLVQLNGAKPGEPKQ
jgi:phage-related protein